MDSLSLEQGLPVQLFCGRYVQEHFFRLRDLTEKARSAYTELVASIERELEDQLSDTDDDVDDSAMNHSRSHSVQSRACSEPEPSSDWLALDDVARGYSSECETGWVGHSEDETLQPIDAVFPLPQHGAAQCLDTAVDFSPEIVQLTDTADSNEVLLSLDVIDSGSVSISQTFSQQVSQ